MKDTAEKLPVICRYLSAHVQNEMMLTANASYKTADESLLNLCRSKVYLWRDLFSKKGFPFREA